ncbi:MAG: flagellar basal body rod C-terminal domain-containing protein [Phycisphaerae bacterium]|nr:flagellar basal body rod C-terminal domain-containing protein [Phycisphaerae bacterium]
MPRLNAAAGVAASFSPDGRATVTADSGYTISFSNDTSGVLAALGINTFFTGHQASDIAVRTGLTPNNVAAALNNAPGDNGNALRLAALANQPVASLDGLTLADQFNQTVTGVASRSADAKSAQESAGTMVEALSAQRDAISGVSLDEESISLMEYQRAFQGASQYISLVNQLLGELMQMI